MILDIAEDVMCRPWDWGGGAECYTAAGDVFCRLWGVDPIALVRGGASDRRSAIRLVRWFGGLEEMLEACAREAGLRPGVGAPGEIGVIRPRRWRVTGVRVGAGWWVVKSRDGFGVVSASGRGWRV